MDGENETWIAHVTREDDDWLTEVKELGEDGANTFGVDVKDTDRMTRDLIAGYLLADVPDEDVTDEEFQEVMARLHVEYDLTALTEVDRLAWLREVS